MSRILQESTNNTSLDPLFDKDLVAIRKQLVEWEQTFGSGKVALWLFDTAFHQVYPAKGFEFTNKLLTQTRHSLKRSEGARNLEWFRRCKKTKAQSKGDESERHHVEAA